MAQPDKLKKVEEISEELSNAKSIFMTDFEGLSVDDMTELRQQFRKAGVKYKIVKNTLAKRSAEKVGYDDMVKYLNGPTGLAMAFEDPIAPVRIIYDFKKTKKKPEIKAAIVEGQILDEKSAEELRSIPTREVLLGQVVAGIASPLSGFVGGLRSLMSNLVYALDQIKDKKES